MWTFVPENREKVAIKHPIERPFYLISLICLQSFVQGCMLKTRI